MIPEKAKFNKLIHHKIGYCANCGWVHEEVRRKRVEEVSPRGKVAIVIPLCLNCIKEFEHRVACHFCGETRGDNLYPVCIMRKQMDEDGHTCNLFIHLCAECRKIPHEEILKRINLPPDICDTCKDKFTCFTANHKRPLLSHIDARDERQFYKRQRTSKYKRGEDG